MRAVLISIKPKYVEKIASGEKTIEVRKTRPKLEVPFKCYIYCTKGFKFNDFKYSLNFVEAYKRSGKVIGEFICDYITSFKAMGEVQALYNETKETCLSHDEIVKYANGRRLYYWHISDLKIYDEPKDLNEFGNLCRKDCLRLGKGKSCEFLSTDGTPCNRIIPITRPPKSWCYVEKGE